MMVPYGYLTIVFLCPDWWLTNAILNASKKEDTGTEEPTTASLFGWFGVCESLLLGGLEVCGLLWLDDLEVFGVVWF